MKATPKPQGPAPASTTKVYRQKLGQAAATPQYKAVEGLNRRVTRDQSKTTNH